MPSIFGSCSVMQGHSCPHLNRHSTRILHLTHFAWLLLVSSTTLTFLASSSDFCFWFRFLCQALHTHLLSFHHLFIPCTYVCHFSAMYHNTYLSHSTFIHFFFCNHMVNAFSTTPPHSVGTAHSKVHCANPRCMISRLDLAWHPTILIMDRYMDNRCLCIVNYYDDVGGPTSLCSLLSLSLDSHIPNYTCHSLQLTLQQLVTGGYPVDTDRLSVHSCVVRMFESS